MLLLNDHASTLLIANIFYSFLFFYLLLYLFVFVLFFMLLLFSFFPWLKGYFVLFCFFIFAPVRVRFITYIHQIYLTWPPGSLNSIQGLYKSVLSQNSAHMWVLQYLYTSHGTAIYCQITTYHDLYNHTQPVIFIYQNNNVCFS